MLLFSFYITTILSLQLLLGCRHSLRRYIFTKIIYILFNLKPVTHFFLFFLRRLILSIGSCITNDDKRSLESRIGSGWKADRYPIILYQQPPCSFEDRKYVTVHPLSSCLQYQKSIQLGKAQQPRALLYIIRLLSLFSPFPKSLY